MCAISVAAAPRDVWHWTPLCDYSPFDSLACACNGRSAVGGGWHRGVGLGMGLLAYFTDGLGRPRRCDAVEGGTANRWPSHEEQLSA